jgi:hypothetical protein
MLNSFENRINLPKTQKLNREFKLHNLHLLKQNKPDKTTDEQGVE